VICHAGGLDLSNLVDNSMPVDISVPILVVDDTPAVREILVSLLKQIGFRDVDVAPDGSAALAKMRARKYSLVISDWQMEPMDGYALLTAIRSDEELVSTPFIMITVHNEVKRVVWARKAGANGFISKPFAAKVLRSKIEQAILGRAGSPAS